MEFGVSRCKLLYIEWIKNNVLLNGTGNYIQYPMINHNGKGYGKGYKKVCVYNICVTESLCYMGGINTTL